MIKGSAEMKFSGFPNNQGSKIDRENKNVNIIIKPKTSFQRKKDQISIYQNLY